MQEQAALVNAVADALVLQVVVERRTLAEIVDELPAMILKRQKRLRAMEQDLKQNPEPESDRDDRRRSSETLRHTIEFDIMTLDSWERAVGQGLPRATIIKKAEAPSKPK